MLKNKTAIVTGGSRGIGRAIVLELARNGANIALIYAGNSAAASETCETAASYGIVVNSYKCDVADFAACRDTVAEIRRDFGSIDVLVNNAGITADKLIMRMEEADFDRVMDVNLKGAFNMIRHVCEPMIKQRMGSIINITSVAGLTGNAGQANYASSKAGLIGLTKTVAKELAARNITCNAIAPGFIETEMTQVLSDGVKEAALTAIPLKRMGSAEDVANAAAFLASDLSKYITGEVLRVDGGLAM